MAGTVLQELSIVFSANVAKLHKGLGQAQGALEKTNRKAKETQRGIADLSSALSTGFKALAGAAALQKMTGLLRNCNAEYRNATTVNMKLAQVMRNTMSARDGEVRAIMDYIDAQELLGVVAGDVQTAGAQELATYLSGSQTLKTLIPVINDMVAQQYGLEASAEAATNIATMLGKVMNGQVGALSRYGYEFDAAQEKILKYGTEAERAATLVDVVSQSVGGMNQALASWPQGQILQLQNTLGKIKETFGEAFQPILSAVLPILMTLAKALLYVVQCMSKFSHWMGKIFGLNMGTAKSADAVASSTEDMANAMNKQGGAAKKADKENKKLLSTLDELNEVNKEKTASSGGASLDTIALAGAGAIELGDEIEEANATLGEIMVGALAWAGLIVGPIASITSTIKNVKDLLSGTKKVADSVAEGIGAAGDVAEAVGNTAEAIGDVVEGAGDLAKVGSSAAETAGNVAETLSSATAGIGGVLEGAGDLASAASNAASVVKTASDAAGIASSLIGTFATVLQGFVGAIAISALATAFENVRDCSDEANTNIEDIKTKLDEIKEAASDDGAADQLSTILETYTTHYQSLSELVIDFRGVEATQMDENADAEEENLTSLLDVYTTHYQGIAELVSGFRGIEAAQMDENAAGEIEMLAASLAANMEHFSSLTMLIMTCREAEKQMRNNNANEERVTLNDLLNAASRHFDALTMTVVTYRKQEKKLRDDNEREEKASLDAIFLASTNHYLAVTLAMTSYYTAWSVEREATKTSELVSLSIIAATTSETFTGMKNDCETMTNGMRKTFEQCMSEICEKAKTSSDTFSQHWRRAMNECIASVNIWLQNTRSAVAEIRSLISSISGSINLNVNVKTKVSAHAAGTVVSGAGASGSFSDDFEPWGAWRDGKQEYVISKGGGGGSRAFATGTITQGPEFALIGEAGPEAVVPLAGNHAQQYAQRYPSLIKRFADMWDMDITPRANGGIISRSPLNTRLEESEPAGGLVELLAQVVAGLTTSREPEQDTEGGPRELLVNCDGMQLAMTVIGALRAYERSTGIKVLTT